MGVKIYDSDGLLKINYVTTLDNNLMPHPGFREDQTTNGFYLGMMHDGVDAGTAHNNYVSYQAWFIPYDVNVVAMTINGDDAGNTGVLNVAMYKNYKGLPTTIIAASSTSMTGAGTGNTEAAVDFDLDAGWYWMGSVETSGDIDIEHTYSNNYGDTAHIISYGASYYGSDWGSYAEAGSALPTSASAGSDTTRSTYIPRIGLRFEAR